MKPSELRPVLAYLVTNWAKGEAVRTLLALVSVAEGAENGQPLTQLDLTRELGIKKPAATHLVSHLVARGVVEQREDCVGELLVVVCLGLGGSHVFSIRNQRHSHPASGSHCGPLATAGTTVRTQESMCRLLQGWSNRRVIPCAFAPDSG